MASFNITITVPDNKLDNVMLALQQILPMNDGEQPGAYIKRLFKAFVTDAAKSYQAAVLQSQIQSQITDPGVSIT